MMLYSSDRGKNGFLFRRQVSSTGLMGWELLAIPRTSFFCISGRWLSLDGDHLLYLEKHEATTFLLSHVSTALIARQDVNLRRMTCQSQASMGTTGLLSRQLSTAQGRCNEYLMTSCWLFDKNVSLTSFLTSVMRSSRDLRVSVNSVILYQSSSCFIPRPAFGSPASSAERLQG